MNLFKLSFLFLFSISVFANNGVSVFKFCKDDELSEKEAIERINWSLKCRLMSKKVASKFLSSSPIQYPTYIKAAKVYDTPINRTKECHDNLTAIAIFEGDFSRVICEVEN